MLGDFQRERKREREKARVSVIEAEFSFVYACLLLSRVPIEGETEIFDAVFLFF